MASPSDMFSCEGLVVVVTGGGTGIGAMIARALDAQNATAVYIIGRREENLKSVAASCTNNRVHPIVGDVTSKESLTSIAEKIKRDHGYINVLIANSGIIGPANKEIESSLPKDGEPTPEEFANAHFAVDMDDFTQAFHVNCTGAWYTSLAFLSLLDAGNKRGNVAQKSQIIITTSIAGFMRKPAAGYAYSVSKAAATHLGKTMASSFATWKIRVNQIAPGPYPSQMNPWEEGKRPYPWEEGGVPASRVPLERMGTEADMAGTVVYMCSKAGGFLNGNVTVSDGGRMGLFAGTY